MFLYHNKTIVCKVTNASLVATGYCFVSGSEMIYENWASSEPSGATDDCAIIGENVGSGFQWDDKSCNDQFGFLCQTGNSLEVVVCVVYVKLDRSVA